MTSIVGKQREMHAAHMTSIVRKQRKRCMLVLSSLSPFYSSWDPNSWNGAPPIHEEWIFPLQLTQSRHPLIDMSKGLFLW